MVLVSVFFSGLLLGAADVLAAEPSLQGCYKKPSNVNFVAIRNTITPEVCAAHCSGYKFALLNYYYNCGCSNEMPSETCGSQCTCNLGCEGNRSIMCGGNGSVDVYRIDGGGSGPSPSPRPLPSPGGRVGSFMVLGDWGYDWHSHGSVKSGCQKLIARKMQDFVNERGDVKFVLNVGDSFYPAGVRSKTDGQWKSKWRNVYGQQITNLPWYSVYGNHDYETKDSCSCSGGAGVKNLHMCNQVNAGQGGWFMPNLYYHETKWVENLGLEIVALDTNTLSSPCGSPWGGYKGHCSRDTCWDTMNKRYAASMDLLATRLKETKADNLLVINHYPASYFAGHKEFGDALKQGSANNANIFLFGGHVHTVSSDSRIMSPAETWLVGGGGGWGCDGGKQGFVAGTIYKDDNGKFSVELEIKWVPYDQCCHAGRRRLQDDEIYKVVQDGSFWNQTCDGEQCNERLQIIEDFAHEIPLFKDLLDEHRRAETGRNLTLSNYFHSTIEAIRRSKVERE